MKGKVNKTTKIKIATVVVILIAIFVGVLYTTKGRNVDNIIYELTPEDKVAMSYNLKTDEDAKIPGNEYVLFDAYFLKDLDNDGFAEKYDGTCNQIKAKTLMYMDINVLTEGKLEGGVIEVKGKNFDYSMSMVKDDVLKNTYISDNVKKIELKDINAGTQKLILGKIIANINNNINNYSIKDNTVTLKGTYVPLEGEPVKIEKTVKLKVDWYGETEAKIEKYSAGIYSIDYENMEDNKFRVTFQTTETKGQLLIKENVSNVIIPELCGYAPTQVTCVSENVETQYDAETRKLTIIRSSNVDEESGIVQNTFSRYNRYTIEVEYPEEAYRKINAYETITFKMDTYYTGYNNTNFTNPYKSNVAKTEIPFQIRTAPKDDVYMFYVDYIDKAYLSSPYYKNVISIQDVLNMYNGTMDVNNKEFVIRWTADRGSKGEVTSLIMKETKEQENYGDDWDGRLMEEYLANTGVYFTGADEMLGENGTISIYNDETDELIHVFTKEEWNTYTRTNPYKYDYKIDHIRVETSDAANNTRLYVFNIKELDVEKLMQNIDEKVVRNTSATYTYLTGICNIKDQNPGVIKNSDIAYFIHEKSLAELSLKHKTAIVYEELEDQEIYINARKLGNNESDWKNGEFLVDVPAEIINMEIKNVSIDNADVEIASYELFQDKNGKYFIRIITKNEEPTTYKITIKCNLVVDPRVSTSTRTFYLYAHNDFCQEYVKPKKDIYDVNSNNDVDEEVGYSYASMEILSPTSILTMETVTDYDSNEDDEITIAPNVALVEREERQAKINIHLTNNYPYTVSGVKILGKIPYQDNTYILNGKSLKSEFSTQITENGVRVSNNSANKIKENTIMYYSEEENPTQELDDANNKWKTFEEVTDWTKIKSYLIDVQETTISRKEKVEFNYDVILPHGLDLNVASFSTHAIYFSLNTEEGKINLCTEPTKVGVKIVESYDLNLTKYRLGSNLTIPGVTYELAYSEKDAEGETQNQKIVVTTDSNGNILLTNLHANVQYTIREISVPNTCEFNGNEVTFIVNENGELTINGERKNASYSNETLTLEFEDEIKAQLKINKSVIGTNVPINNVLFEATAEDGSKISGKTEDGVVDLKGISLGKIYTLREKTVPNTVKARDEIFKFRIYKDLDGIVKFEKIENSLAEEDYILTDNENTLTPQLEVNVKNELRYTVTVEKNDENGNILPGVAFTVTNERNQVSYGIQTNSQGKASVNRLNVGDTYKLAEVNSPGYYLDSSKDNSVSFKVERGANNKLEINVISTNGEIIMNSEPIITEEGVNAEVKFTVENKKIPTYNLKVIKKNEDGETLAGAQFKLTSIDTQTYENITVNENGEAEISGLYEYISGKYITGEYELTETYAPEGYKINNTPLRFKAERTANGKLEFIGISGMDIIKENAETGDKEVEADENTITISILNKPIFNIIKYGDGETLLPNAKFILTDLDGNSVVDVNGNYVGILENGNYVITTDENGKITASLAPNLYKVVEIEAPTGYELPQNEADRTYYFGIGESRPAEYSDSFDDISWANEIGNNVIKNDETGTANKTVNELVSTDNGVLVLTYNEPNNVITKYDLDGNKINEVVLTNYDDLLSFNQSVPGENILIVTYSGDSFEYDGNQINITPGAKNYITIKLDDNGNYKSSLSFVDNENGALQGTKNNGNIMIYANGLLKEYNSAGEVVSSVAITEPDSVYTTDDPNYKGTIFSVRRIITSNGCLEIVYFQGIIKHNGTDLLISGIGSQNIYPEGFYLFYFNEQGEYQWQKSSANIYYRNPNAYSKKLKQVYYDFDQEKFIISSNGNGEDFFFALNEQGVVDNDKYYYVNKTITPPKKINYIDENQMVKPGYYMCVKNTTNNYSYYGGTIRYTQYIGSRYRSEETQNISVSKENSYVILLTDENFNLLWYDEVDGNISDFEPAKDGSYYLAGEYKEHVSAMGKGNVLVANDNKTNLYLLKYGRSQTKPEIADVSEINVINELKKYKITTEVAEDNEGQRIGGEITGIYNGYYPEANNIKYVETVKYGKDSSNEIVIEPDANYVINQVDINGVNIPVETDEDGKMKLPAGYFENVKEDKHIVVRFVRKNNSITIIKEDTNGNPLPNAKFNITEVKNSPELGDPVVEGSLYYNDDLSVDYSDRISKMKKSDTATYYYEEQQDGTYKTNNENARTTAYGYFEIDLENLEGQYKIKLGHSTYNTTSINISYNIRTSLDATSNYATLYYVSKVDGITNYEAIIEGGRKYYLLCSFYKYYDTNYLTIHGVDVIKTNAVRYGFDKIGDKYVPNNIGITGPSARSHVPVDLTNEYGEYEIKVNAEMIGGQYDYAGIAINTESSVESTYNPMTPYILNINGTNEKTDYTYKVSGGKKYYLHLNYSKGTNSATEDDKFIINSITVNPINNTYTVISNSEGKATMGVNSICKYKIKEIQAPDGYLLTDKEYEIEIDGTSENNEITIVNEKKAKVIVHHYLEGTGEEYNNEPVELADNETVDGKVGTSYTTAPNMEIEGYTLVKNENGEYKIPENATGRFTQEEQHVYYYYNVAPVSLTVHHYLEGTQDKLAEDEYSSYNIGDHYKTNPSEEVLENYELTSVVGDEEKDITKDEEVTYYYVKKQHEITTRVETISYLGKSEKGGEITGEGDAPYETVPHGDSNVKQIKMTPKVGFKIDDRTINKIDEGEVIESTKIENEVSPDGTYTLPTINHIEHDYEIVVKYVPDLGKVIVHHYIEGTETKIAPDEITIDDYGKVVKTKPVDTSKYDMVEDSDKYILVESPAEPNVTLEKQDKEVTYYYQAQYKITTEVVPYTITKTDGTTEKILGGTITGDGEDPYEKVMKGKDSENPIKATPEEGYEIVSIRINGEEYDFADKLASDGSVTLDQFTNMDEDKHVEVEFRKIQEASKLEIVVKHIEVDEKDKKNGLTLESGKLLNQESFLGVKGELEELARKEFIDEVTERKYISVDGPSTEVAGDVVVAKKSDNKLNVEYVETDKDGDGELDVLEVRFYYEKQYNVTTDVKSHDELINEVVTSIEGGTISGKGLDSYEMINKNGTSQKSIVATPESGYRVKSITVNGVEIDFAEYETPDKKVTIPVGYFKEITHDKHVVVEFEKIIEIPAKVVVKYLEEGTDKELKEQDAKEGKVGDEYTTERAIIEGYEKAGKEPTNANGKMTERDIVVVYYYKKVEKPDEPVKPDEPSKPDEPDTPVKPDEPSKPNEPDTPVKPDEPSKPDKPDTPVKPDKPEKPDEPDTPIKPDEPEKTNESDTPVKPDKPEQSEQSSDNNKKNTNKEQQTSPQTGDNMIITVIVGLVGLILFVLTGRKERFATRKNSKHYVAKHLK